MMSPVRYVRQVSSELRKVFWPSRKETTVSTIMVFVLVIMSMLFFLSVDSILNYIVKVIIELARVGS